MSEHVEQHRGTLRVTIEEAAAWLDTQANNRLAARLREAETPWGSDVPEGAEPRPNPESSQTVPDAPPRRWWRELLGFD